MTFLPSNPTDNNSPVSPFLAAQVILERVKDYDQEEEFVLWEELSTEKRDLLVKKLWKPFRDKLETIMVMLDKRYIADSNFTWFGDAQKVTIRDTSDPKRINNLLNLNGTKERLQLFEANLLGEGSFDSIIQGCHGVLMEEERTKVPFLLLIKPMQKGKTLIVDSSVGIIMANKQLMSNNDYAFTFATTLTGFHFAVTVLVGLVSNATGYFASKHVPMWELLNYCQYVYHRDELQSHAQLCWILPKIKTEHDSCEKNHRLEDLLRKWHISMVAVQLVVVLALWSTGVGAAPQVPCYFFLLILWWIMATTTSSNLWPKLITYLMGLTSLEDLLEVEILDLV
ncbi:hypothetical protein SESBI_12110 [Sesbania bispinosa]|nr:hypothetical protein SESBI_12110 [Sesbania bispinosa]